jgi:hypothetical protein
MTPSRPKPGSQPQLADGTTSRGEACLKLRQRNYQIGRHLVVVAEKSARLKPQVIKVSARAWLLD